MEYVHVPGTQNVIMSRLPARFFDEEERKAVSDREGVGTEVAAELGGEKYEYWEVAVVTAEERSCWERWFESNWYGEVVRYLLVSSKEGEDLTARRRRLVRWKAKRYRLFGEKEKGVFYVKRGEKVARCVDEDEVL